MALIIKLQHLFNSRRNRIDCFSVGRQYATYNKIIAREKNGEKTTCLSPSNLHQPYLPFGG